MTNDDIGRNADTPAPGDVRRDVEHRTARSTERLAGDAREAAAEARSEATRTAEDLKARGAGLAQAQKQRAADQVTGLTAAVQSGARQLHHQGQPLSAGLFEQAAGALDQFARGLLEGDPATWIRRTEDLARRQPGLFLGGAVVAGFLMARFLKSGSGYGARRYIGGRYEAYAETPAPRHGGRDPDPLSGAPDAIEPAEHLAPEDQEPWDKPAVRGADPFTGAPGAMGPTGGEPAGPARPQRDPDPLSGAPDAIEPAKSVGSEDQEPHDKPVVRDADPFTGAPGAMPEQEK